MFGVMEVGGEGGVGWGETYGESVAGLVGSEVVVLSGLDLGGGERRINILSS